jgi:hypothetical protein
MTIEIIKGKDNSVAEFFSSPSNTPETDEQFKSFPAYFEIDLFCRKLERQRDEARAERDEASELLASEKITRNHIIRRSVQVERERDEWRECAEKLAEIIGAPDEMESRLWKTDDEINEAWSVFDQLKEGAK